MRVFWRSNRRSILCAALVACWSVGVAPLFAEDLIVPRLERPVIITAEVFDDMVRGGTGEEAKMSARCAALLAHEIQVLDQVCALSDSQKRKLQLAGRGDIKAFIDRVYELRTRYIGVPMTQENHEEIRRAIDQLRTTNRWDLFHENSLFRKMLRRTLTEDQVDQLVAWVVAEWDLRVRDVHFDADVQRRLARLLRSRTSPPLGWSYYTYHVLSLQMAAIEDEVRPLVVASEWPAFAQQLAEAKQLEPKLRDVGAWPVRTIAESEE